MKLYTEEMVRNFLKENTFIREEIIEDMISDSLTPIELPSDEEIEKTAKQKHIGLSKDVANYRDCFNQGAKWVIDKIKNQKYDKNI